MDEKLKYALILASVFNFSLVSTNFYQRTFDAYTHMFFADHYRRSWFNTWEPKWFGGFSVTSYPPLAHQVIALTSYILGLELAYLVLTLCLTVIVPIAAYKFSRIFVSNEAAGYAAIISVFLPSVPLITYNFGQFPTLFSLAATLFTIHDLDRYLRNGTRCDLGLACCLLGVSTGAHHLTTIFFLPLLLLILVITLFQRGTDFKTLAKRLLNFIIVGIVVSIVVIYPFLVFSSSIKMQPIPHITRTNLFSDPFAFEWFFLGMYGPLLTLIPLVGYLVYYRRKLLPLFAGAILLFILGLGGTTILPKLIFGDLWLVLTYERFALWAGITFLPLFGFFFAYYFKELKRGRFKEKILIIFFVVLIFSASYFGNNSILQPTNVNLEPLLEFLGTNENSRWRYLTLGFGDAKMQELSLFTNASTIDGYYFLGRTVPVLMSSGIAALDTAKYFGEHGLQVLETVLKSAHEYNLRWVFCNDPFYYNLLVENGFIMLFSQDTTSDGRLHGVTIWGKAGIPPIEIGSPTGIHACQSALFDYMWGIVPLSFLITSLVLFVSAIFLKKRKDDKISSKMKNDGEEKTSAKDKQEIMRIWDNAYVDNDEDDHKLIWNRLNLFLWRKIRGLVDSKSLVLEAGCGISVLMNALAVKRANVVGIDISSVALKKAHRLYKKPFLIQGDINHLPFRDDTFDLVYSIGVIEHFNNPGVPLKETCGVLKSSGVVLIGVPNRFNLWTVGRDCLSILNRLHLSNPWKYGYERSYTKSELRDLFASLGFETPEVFGCGTFEGFYVTAYFSLGRPKLMRQFLFPLLSNETASLWGKILHHFSETSERVDALGLLTVAYSHPYVHRKKE